ASSLRPLFDQLEQAFEAEYPNVDVRPSYLSSGAAHAQIIHGAPFAVLVAADTSSPAALERAGVARPDTRVVYTRGVLVLWISNRTLTSAGGDSALADPRVRRVAIANPDVAPYGQAALEVLAGFGNSRRTVIHGEDAAQAAQMAGAGADAALLPLSLAQSPSLRAAGRVITLADSTYSHIWHAAVALQD